MRERSLATVGKSGVEIVKVLSLDRIGRGSTTDRRKGRA